MVIANKSQKLHICFKLVGYDHFFTFKISSLSIMIPFFKMMCPKYGMPNLTFG